MLLMPPHCLLTWEFYITLVHGTLTKYAQKLHLRQGPDKSKAGAATLIMNQNRSWWKSTIRSVAHRLTADALTEAIVGQCLLVTEQGPMSQQFQPMVLQHPRKPNAIQALSGSDVTGHSTDTCQTEGRKNLSCSKMEFTVQTCPQPTSLGTPDCAVYIQR